ncbi:MAG: ribokinase [Mycobacteriales bacterium]
MSGMGRPARPGPVVVLGSCNLDLVLPVERIPGPGETMLAAGLSRVPGGKGANQAVAAARAGVDCRIVGAVGRDDAGRLLRSALAESTVDVSALRELDVPTGLAVVTVAADGENAIVVAAGANAELAPLLAAELASIAGAAVLLVQLEVPVDAVRAGAAAARRAGALVLLNAAPARPLPVDLLGLVDLLVVNEHEAAALAGLPGADPDHAAQRLARTVPAVVVTLGAAGSLYRTAGGHTERVPAVPARVVDTTGAGDTFCGVLAAELAAGRPVGPAIRWASAAASLAVEAAGAVPSIPDRAAIAGRYAAHFTGGGRP